MASAARAPTASLRDGCATLAPDTTTSKAVRTRGTGEERAQPRRCSLRTIRGRGRVVRGCSAGQGRFGSSL